MSKYSVKQFPPNERFTALLVEHLDYMLFDPFIYHGMAETHDRHRDMRLDVDNMSYEELLALEERIGDVSTGLSEETILKLMKQQKYSSTTTESPQELEPCCICQEEYADGDDTGTLDCGHDFHTNCIKQWLMLKNLCPICKTTALLK
ncbi:zinc finger protein [Theobroma cacao]|nr:zinc finger protein [Theobroma cacao]